jgi:hypothetical protein
MNALVVLLMTAVPAADPLPTTSAAPAPFPSYSYTQNSWSGQSDDNRPRFFGRIRGIFRRRSQGGDQAVPDSAPAYSSSWNAVPGTVGGTVGGPAAGRPVISSAPSPSSPGISSAPASSPVIRPTPAYNTREGSPAQRMPSGEAPF